MIDRRRISWLGFVLGVAACSATSSSKFDGASSGSGADSGGVGGGLSVTSGLGSGESSTGSEMACGMSTVGNEVPGALLLLLDKSGSMQESANGNNGPSKWSATVSAVKAMVKGSSPTLEVGLLPFPEGKFNSIVMQQCIFPIPGLPQPPNCPQILADGGCKDVATQPVVPVKPLLEKGAAIMSWLDQSDPDGGTPTLHALRNAYAIMKAHPTPGQRYVLLVTDGVPNTAQPPVFPLPAMQSECGELPDIEKEAALAANGTPPVHTFVIGSPGSEGAAESLSTIALNGMTAKDPACSPKNGDCHYQIGSANFEKELADVLAAIAGSVGDCVFDMPEGQNVDPNLVNVTVATMNGPQEVLKDPAHADGWDYADGEKTKIQLYGPACDAYKASKGNTITIILGCESKIK
jgi:hypothetical protein